MPRSYHSQISAIISVQLSECAIIRTPSAIIRTPSAIIRTPNVFFSKACNYQDTQRIFQQSECAIIRINYQDTQRIFQQSALFVLRLKGFNRHG